MVKLRRIEEAKVIKRNLPIQNYTIIDGYVLDDEKSPCDNCNKLLTNVVVVKGQDGKEYNVGTDCAATLSGIDADDIEYWNDAFKQSKSIRAKINKWCKQVGSKDYYLVVEHMSWGVTKILVYWKDKPDKWSSLEVGNDIGSLKDFIKYCPDLAKKTYINPKAKPLSPQKDYKKAPENSGESFEGYTVEYSYDDDRKICNVSLFKNGDLLSKRSSHIYEKNPSKENITEALQKLCIEVYLDCVNKDKSEWKLLTDVIR